MEEEEDVGVRSVVAALEVIVAVIGMEMGVADKRKGGTDEPGEKAESGMSIASDG